jgi:hypothetical protein
MEEWVQLGAAILSFVAALWVLRLLLRNSRTCQAIAERATLQRQLTPATTPLWYGDRYDL